MASSNSTITQEIVSILDQILPQDYVLVAVATMVFFEYIITVPQEVELVWRRKVSGSTIMFLLNRYIVVAFSILQICLVPSASTPKSCEAISVLSSIVDLAQYISIAAFSALRAYAISGRDWRPTSAISVLLMTSVGLNLYAYSKLAYAEVIVLPVLNNYAICNWGFYLSTTYATMLSYTTGACTIACDLIVLLVTWMKTYRIKREASKANIKATLVTLLLRDGTIYFVVLAILTAIDMASSAFGSTATLQQIVTYFQATLPNILICRFLMNLHHSDDSSDDTSTSQLQSSGMPTTSLGFSSRLASRVVGNMGATLDHGSFSLTTTDDRGGLDSDMDISTSHDEDRAGSDGVEDIMQVQ